MATRYEIMNRLDNALFLEPAAFDEAIIGVAERFGMEPVVCYDRTRCIDILARGMTREDAEEFFEFNTIGAWLGDLTPVFVDTRPAE
ncbi:hypothetical protein UFOVP715_33 [uncultured Caudovirales phage]|uniref:Uncharacterized protein n=1 Tax=uncultured Caudovirales phage TaxID=2100421 RepID=A0A6J5NWK2_9CAUD|nr:hypothetical protein UFOVP715_33 [uncultured Caudovirales phage]